MGLSYVVEHSTNKSFFTFFSEFNMAWKESYILIDAILGLLFAMSLGGNILVISFFIRFKAIRQVTNLFITNLAVSDLLFSTIVPLVMTTRVTQDWLSGEVLCHLLTSIEIISGIVSAWTMVLISLDRHRAIVKLQGRRSTLNGTMVRVVLVWIGAFLFTSPIAIFFRTVESTIYIEDDSGSVQRNVTVCTGDFPGPHYVPLIYSCVNIIVVFIIPLSIITRNYRAVMCKFASSLQRMRDHMESAPGSQHSSVRQAANVHKEARVLRMLITMVGLFVLMWGPVTVFLVALMADYGNRIIQSHQLIVVFIITYTNTALNPVVYGILNEQYRSQFRQLFSKAWCKVCACHTSVAENTVGRNSIRQVIRTLSSRELNTRRLQNGDDCCENVIDNICEETPS